MPAPQLIFSARFPGKYAANVLAGAVEAAPDLTDVSLAFPRVPEDLLAAVREASAHPGPLVVAWSFYSPSFPECAAELASLRAALPDARFLAIAGGVHATAEPREVLEAGFDLVCVGEGERALRELLRRLRDGVSPESTPGFASLERGALRQNPRPPRIALDDFPPFAPGHRRYGAIELTRGCLYACRFCQTPYFSKAMFRHRSPEDVARWVRVLREHDKPDVRFITPTALSYGSDDESVRLDAIEDLLARAREAAGPHGRLFLGTFPSELRPEHVSLEALAVLKRYVANDNLVIGGQSGSDRVLAESRRGHDVESIRRAVRLCVEGGFLPQVDFILGLPGEGPEDVEATVALMRELSDLGARVHGHTFMPLPGTPFRNAPPGRIEPATQKALERLASQQKLYGHWKAQVAHAEAIARRRDAKPR